MRMAWWCIRQGGVVYRQKKAVLLCTAKIFFWRYMYTTFPYPAKAFDSRLQGALGIGSSPTKSHCRLSSSCSIHTLIRCRQGCLCFGLCGPHRCSADTGAEMHMAKSWQAHATRHWRVMLLFSKLNAFGRANKNASYRKIAIWRSPQFSAVLFLPPVVKAWLKLISASLFLAPGLCFCWVL